MGEYQLSREIIARSVSDTWYQARKEWILAEVYFADEPDQCLCGKYPIIEICVLYNSYNRNEAIVGNHCVKKFLGLPSDHIFAGLRRIHKDIEKAINLDTLEYVYRRKWINDWEYKFYLDTYKKRSLSYAQASKRRQINEKIIKMVQKDTRPVRNQR